jgi:hypothetical protein
MDINTINFIAFFLLCLFLYYHTKSRYRNAFLLAASYLFYMQAMPAVSLLVLAAACVCKSTYANLE